MVWIPDERPAARGGGPPPKLAPPKTREQPIAATRPAVVPLIEPTIITPEPEPRVVADATLPATPLSADTLSAQPAGLGDTNGKGSGPGPGTGSGPDGVTYGVGNGVTSPIPLGRPPPAYTSEAIRARLQGVVRLNCVVQTDGTCTEIRVTR